MKKFILLIMVLYCATPYPANAQGIDIEIDPIAYIFKGYSMHIGYNSSHIRYDIGVFGIEVPEWINGNDGFYNYGWGVGAKVDYYMQGTGRGLFAGISGDVVASRVRWKETGSGETNPVYAVGVTVGYKLPVTNNLYIKPWLNMSYMFDMKDIYIDGQVFEQSSIRPFPTIHIGWHF